MILEKEIRKLARSEYWQTLYSMSKDGHAIQFFNNVNSLSGPQVSLLQWLRTYDMLYTEKAQKESYLLTDNVIKDDIRCNAYLYVRRIRIENEWAKHQQDKKVDEAKSRHHFKNDDNVSVIDVKLLKGGTAGRRD